MHTIICKKCGAKIDASLGECPNCGTVYYILSEEDKTLEWAMNMEADPDETRVIGKKEDQGRSGSIHSTSDLLNADNDELFNTRVWKLSEDPDETKAIRMQPAEKPKKPVPPVQRPVRRNTPPDNGNGRDNKKQPPENKMDLRKKQLIVAAVGLVAVLTLVLSIMSGAFDFGGGDEKNDKMPYVVGSTQDVAEALLRDNMGLKVTSMREESEALENTVIDQSIKEGRKVKKGDSVVLIISSGKAVKSSDTEEYTDVPSLIGKTYDQAKRELDKYELSITSAEDVFSDEEIGKIISQYPLKGAKLKKGDLVTVTISKGPEPSPSPKGHTISVTAGKGGSISPKGLVVVEEGKDQTFTITPDEGYEVKEVKVDGTSIGLVQSYTFTKVSGDHSIYAVFKKKEAVPETPPENPIPPIASTVMDLIDILS